MLCQRKDSNSFLFILKRDLEYEIEIETKDGKPLGDDKEAISKRLEQIYKRLEYIDAYSAESRAASILAVSAL